MSADIIRTIAKANDVRRISQAVFVFCSNARYESSSLNLLCMDPRANPTDFWNLGEDGPPVVRNAGGRVTEDTLRSVRTLAEIMGNGRNTIGVVAIIHHTDCGLSHFSNEQVAVLLNKRSRLEGVRAEEVSRMEFGSWSDAASPEESVKRDMNIVKWDPYLPKDLEIIDFVYDVFTGKTKEVGTLL